MKFRQSPRQIVKLEALAKLTSAINAGEFPKDAKVSPDRMAKFETEIKGKIVYPWSPGYDHARKDFNDVYPAYPEAIVYAVNYQDVRLSLQLAREQNLWTAIRSGGHSLAGYSVCDGLVIDMSEINNVFVDVSKKTVTVDAGCTFDKLFPIIEMYGLHVPGGGCPSVAVAGYMQGGGYGMTSRMYGMQCDNVIQVTVMLASGKIVVANEMQNEDLFWAVRGGTGGNFGVLLNITYQLHTLGDIYGAKIEWVIDDNLDNASQALFVMQQSYLTPATYPNLGIETILSTDTDGLMKIFFCCTWIGSVEDFENALQPLLSVPTANVVLRTEGGYSKVNSDVLEGTPVLPPNVKAYSRSAYIERFLSQADWKNVLTFFQSAPNKFTMVDMECYGGAINEHPEGWNAFVHRNVTMDFFCDAFFNKQTDDQKENEIWLEKFFEFMRQYSNGHSYQNYPNRLQEDFRWAYWGKYYSRLVSIKSKYDPENFFHYQQSIGLDTAGIDLSEQEPLLSLSEISYESY